MTNEGARKELERRMTQDEAEKLIAGILQRFEQSSGDLVTAVEIRNVEVTRIDDIRPRWMTQVVIRTQRTPGRDWVIDNMGNRGNGGTGEGDVVALNEITIASGGAGMQTGLGYGQRRGRW